MMYTSFKTSVERTVTNYYILVQQYFLLVMVIVFHGKLKNSNQSLHIKDRHSKKGLSEMKFKLLKGKVFS